MVANNASYTYNEVLHVWIELGIFGVLLLMAIFITALSSTSQDRTDRAMKAGVTAFIVFSMFSYPSGVWVLLVLCACLLGILPGKTVWQMKIGERLGRVNPAPTVFVLIIFGFLFTEMLSIKQRLTDEIYTMYVEKEKAVTPYCDRYFERLVYNPDFNVAYLSALNQFQPDKLSKIERILPLSETYCNLGQAYEHNGQPGNAEKCYIHASYMIPTRIMPNYLLWQLYVEQGKQTQARAVAEKILAQPIKIENTQTLRIRGKMMRFLDETSSIPNFSDKTTSVAEDEYCTSPTSLPNLMR
jgi:hypothetical protein